MNQLQRALFLRSLQTSVPQAFGLSETICSQLEQRAPLGALQAATTAGPAQEDTSSRGGKLLRWLGSGTLLFVAQACSSPAQAKSTELPKEPRHAEHQLHDETGNRGGEASTSSADQSSLEPIGNEHTAKWKVYTTMARKLAEQKKLVEAEGYLKRALQEAKAGFGEDDPHVAGACNNLAELHRLKKEIPEAEALYQQCVDKMRSCYGNDDIRVGAALHNMAGLYLSTTPPDHIRAETILREALDVKRRAVGDKHPEYVQSLVALAEVKHAQQATPDALLLFKQAADILQHQDPTFSAGNVLQYVQLASVLVQAGQYSEAEALLHQLLLHVETVKGANHPDVGLLCQEMAVLMERTQRLPQARDLLQRGLDIRSTVERVTSRPKRILEASQARYQSGNHPALVDPLLALAAIELRQGDTASWQRAYNIAGRAREVVETNLRALDKRLHPAGPSLSSSLNKFFFAASSPTALDPKVVSQLGVAFLLTSAKLATSLRLMGLAEKKLKRDEEAEETLVSAMSVFTGSHIRTCLQKLYAEADDTMDSDLGSAVATTVKTSIVKRILEVYAACAIQLAELVKKREARGSSGDGASEVDALQKGSEILHAQGVAAQVASTKDVLAVKWLPP